MSQNAFNPGYPYRITSYFGERIRNNKPEHHSGIDYAAPEGTRVPAAADGIVVFSNFNTTYGYTVIVKHLDVEGREVYTLYAHLKEKTLIAYGAHIKAGDKIGEVGMHDENDKLEKTSGTHFHFEVLQPDGYDSQGPYFEGEGKKWRLFTGKDETHIGFVSSFGRNKHPEEYCGFKGDVFGKRHSGYHDTQSAAAASDMLKTLSKYAAEEREASANANPHPPSPQRQLGRRDAKTLRRRNCPHQSGWLFGRLVPQRVTIPGAHVWGRSCNDTF